VCCGVLSLMSWMVCAGIDDLKFDQKCGAQRILSGAARPGCRDL